MRITNNSMYDIKVIRGREAETTLKTNASLHTDSRKVTLKIDWLPFEIEIAEEPEEVKTVDQPYIYQEGTGR